MTATTEVADLLKPVQKALDDVRNIIQIVRAGAKYLNEHHPNARQDLKDLLEELGKLLRVAAQTSSIVIDFNFTVEGSTAGQDLRTFNDRLLEHRTVYEGFRAQLNQVRSRSSTIGDRVWRLKKESGGGALAVVNAPRPSADRLEEILTKVWSDDSKVIAEFQSLDRAVKRALDDVSSKLGPGNQMLAKNVPLAATALAQHARAFQPIESSANFTEGDLQITLLELRGP